LKSNRRISVLPLLYFRNFLSFRNNVSIIVHYDATPFWISDDTDKNDLERPWISDST